MGGITANELELLACFGVEPKLDEPGTPWAYNEALYLVEVDGLSVSLAVQPSDRYLRLIVRRGEQTLFEINGVGVQDLKVIHERAVDELEIVLSEGSSLNMQLRPVFGITQWFER